MSTKAQIRANRKNARKSTGPRTAKGKAVVSQNAVKHGLCAAEAVIKGENQADFEAFRDELLAELAPVGIVESILAERAVSLSWRLQRAERIQNQAIDDAIEHKVTNPLPKSIRFLRCEAQEIPLGDPRRTTGHLPLGRIANSDWAICKMLERLSLYERRMEGSLFRTMHELERRRLIRELKAEAADEEPAIPKASGLEAATQSSPSPSDEAPTRTEDQRGKNAKQSQFPPAKMGVSAFSRKDYENKPRRGLRGKKPKQSQFQDTTHARKDREEEKRYREVVCGSVRNRCS